MFFKKQIKNFNLSMDTSTNAWWVIVEFNDLNEGLALLNSMDTGRDKKIILQSSNFYFKSDSFWMYYEGGKVKISFLLAKGLANWATEIKNKTCKVFIAG